jgi:urea transporter
MGCFVATLGTLFIPLGSAASQNAIAYTYCAGLVGLGLGSFAERFSAKTILLFCLFSFFITLALSQLFAKFNIPILNLPYVITMWIAILSRVPRLNVSWSQ